MKLRIYILLNNKYYLFNEPFYELFSDPTMTLHIITRSDTHSQSIHNCLSVANSSDALLFIEDGTYCQRNPTLLQKINERGIKTYWLQPDLTARGLTSNTNCNPNCNPNCNVVDYSGFVALTEKHSASQTWG
ncbi:MAG: sulfurtransferase complex subunit TusB [Moraxellaceae bacterium]|nr:MAG: sulfurtransferase complex subunit TusB [Moraxellaceae bacterium]